MWRPRGKSTNQTSASPTFSCSSFKDIQNLCLDEALKHQNQHHQDKPSSSPPLTRKPSIFHRVRLANSLLRTWSTHLHPQSRPPKLSRALSQPEPPQPDVLKPEPDVSKPERQPPIYFPGTEERVVVYYTSLHAVRPTFDACKNVLSILCGFRVLIDDRDVSMDTGFATELNHIMGLSRNELGLPRVFIAGRYVGGIEEVRQLNEVGELKKLLEDLPQVDPTECHVCAGHRFILCDKCIGSRKLYIDGVGFKTCNTCNENGLLRCPSCLASAPSSSSSQSQFNHQIQK